jgi:hypothetical protein
MYAYFYYKWIGFDILRWNGSKLYLPYLLQAHIENIFLRGFFGGIYNGFVIRKNCQNTPNFLKQKVLYFSDGCKTSCFKHVVCFDKDTIERCVSENA